MDSFRIFDRQARRVVVALGLLLATIAPAFVSTFASAAQVTERSIALSSSSKAAAGVEYTVNFTTDEAAGAFIVDFCSDSPIIGQSCAAPTGFSLSSVTTSTSGFTRTVLDANTIMLVGTMTAAEDVSVALANVTNPTAAGPLYARIVTYDTSANADDYTSGDLGTGNVDEGGVAISITDTVGVTGAVLESMTFCAASQVISANCGDASGHAPVLKLGETSGSTVALDSTHLSTGDIFTQISTNAANGAVVNLKSGISCGGLKRVESATCDIAPAGTGGFSQGTAKFGVKAAADGAQDLAVSASGAVFRIHPTSVYDGTNYSLNWVSGNATGISSVYGDPILDTSDGPTNNRNVKLTFGASVSNNTPAGNYAADLSLIATGKF